MGPDFPARIKNKINLKKNSSKNMHAPSLSINDNELSTRSKPGEIWHATTQISADLEVNLKKMETNFQYLLAVRSPKNIFNDPVCSEILSYFKEFTFSNLLRECLIRIDPCNKYSFHFILADLLSFGLPLCVEYVRDPDQASDYQKSVFASVNALFDFSWYFAEMSFPFHCKFVQANGIQVLISYISDLEFIEQCLKNKHIDLFSPICCNALTPLSKIYYNTKPIKVHIGEYNQKRL
jgi:hypothetical protein